MPTTKPRSANIKVTGNKMIQRTSSVVFLQALGSSKISDQKHFRKGKFAKDSNLKYKHDGKKGLT